MRTGDDEAAFRIFDRLSRYEGEAPPGLVDGAKLGRDLLDPDLTPTEKADQFFDLFPGRIIHIYNADQGDEPAGLSPPDDRDEPARSVLPLDQPTMTWLTCNDLFTSAFRSLERGDLEEADRVFAEFLERTKDDPSASLRATVMLARNAIEAQRSSRESATEPEQVISRCLHSLLSSSRLEATCR